MYFKLNVSKEIGNIIKYFNNISIIVSLDSNKALALIGC